jgi:hypothetical protein
MQINKSTRKADHPSDIQRGIRQNTALLDDTARILRNVADLAAQFSSLDNPPDAVIELARPIQLRFDSAAAKNQPA